MVTKIDINGFVNSQSDEFALVDFSADWCGPCQMLKPIIEEVSAEYEGKINFYNIDIDECPELAKKYGIMSIPFVAIFKKGELIANNIGFMQKEAVKEFIDKNLR